MNKSIEDIKICELTNDFIDRFSYLMDEYRVFYGRQSNFVESRDYVQNLLDNENVFFLMAVKNSQEIIGFCTLFKSFSSVGATQIFILNDLYVCKQYRRCGYGFKLLESAVSLAEAKGINYLKLETAKKNLIAQAVYKKHGWQLSDFLSYDYQMNLQH